MNIERKYEFSWALLGDIDIGRPHLGNTTRLEVYRLMQFTFRDVIEFRYGAEIADQIFFEAGKKAGKAFYTHFIAPVNNMNDFIRKTQSAVKDLNIGILRIEQANFEKNEIILTVAEDLDCSGLPELGFEVCTYDEGFLAALLEGYFQKTFTVKEIDCWCTGDRTCRFKATADE